MELYDLMMKRRSVRSFEDRGIPERVVDELLDAVLQAPSGGNIQPISVVVVTEAERRQTLAEMVGRQPWVRNAPLSMVFCLDFYRLRRWSALLGAPFRCHNALSHFLIGYADLMCAAQNVVILAQGHGLGSVYIGTIQVVMDQVRQYLEIPQYVLPMMLLSLGYPKRAPKHIAKMGRSTVIHRERYVAPGDDEIREAFEEKYGSLDENVEKYFAKVFVEAIEAEKQDDESWAVAFKEKMKTLEIKNNAQFLFELKYPADRMVKLNDDILCAMRNAGFVFSTQPESPVPDP